MVEHIRLFQKYWGKTASVARGTVEFSRLFQKDRGKTTSAARIRSPNPTRRPLPCLLIKSFFYGLYITTQSVKRTNQLRHCLYFYYDRAVLSMVYSTYISYRLEWVGRLTVGSPLRQVKLGEVDMTKGDSKQATPHRQLLDVSHWKRRAEQFRTGPEQLYWKFSYKTSLPQDNFQTSLSDGNDKIPNKKKNYFKILKTTLVSNKL